MRELPFLIIAGFLLLWGVIAAVRSPPNRPTTDSVAGSSSLFENTTGALPPDVAELSPADASGFFVPSSLCYPGWRLLSTGNPALYTSRHGFTAVKQWYWQHLPSSSVAEMEPGRHAIVANQDFEVELRAVQDGTNIRIQPRPQRDSSR